jgi:hypothetical protein
MPGKSRHAKGKHHRSKKSKAKQRQGAISVPQVTAGTPGQATATGTISIPKTVTSPAKIRTMQYPYIASELRTIGILAGIIIVILIISALVFS